MNTGLSEITNAINSVATSMKQQINIGTIASIVVAVLSGSLVLYVGWFGIRKLIYSVKNALHGRLVVGSEAHRRYYKNKLGWDDEDYNDNFDQW